DVVLLLEKETDGYFTQKKKGRKKVRLLNLVFADKVIGYKLSFSSKQLIFCSICGGDLVEPLQTLKILEDKSIVVHQYGGGSIRWSTTLKFRYKNNDWYVDSFQRASFDTPGKRIDKIVSYNTIDGIIEVSYHRTINGRRVKRIEKEIRHKNILKLKDFHYRDFSRY
ncbi:MAG: hypothetical protein KDK90_20795, partial [Leptospiraceae bacterium]|nr:hypothetical protein [Leptospiraceae bacterium]